VQDDIIIALIVIARAAWVGVVVSVIATNRSL